MWSILQQDSFLLGAALLLVYQAANFGQLNPTDPITGRYVTLLPGAQVRDFSGPYAYQVALGAFLCASLVAYALLCQVGPNTLAGAVRLLSGADPSAQLQGVPFPLYVAALFMGLTQPVVPGLARFRELQRDFFHGRIDVPRRIVDLSEQLTIAIEARSGADRRRLADEVRRLAGNDFMSSLQRYGDVAFYRRHLQKLELDGEAALNSTIKESSVKELRALIEQLVVCALVAVMRRSGPKSLVKIGEMLGAPRPADPPSGRKVVVASFIASGVLFFLGLLVVANVLCLLSGPAASLFGKTAATTLWPDDLGEIGAELRSIVPPILVCLVVSVSLLVPQGPAATPDTARAASLVTGLVEFFRSSASVLGLCIALAFAMKLGQLFHEYGTLYLPDEARSASRLILPVIQSLVAIAVCLFTTWYLVSHERGEPGLSFASTLAAIAAVTGLIAWLYGQTFLSDYLQVHREYAPAREYVAFGIVANVLVSLCAFASVALFFKARQDLPEIVRAHDDRRRA